MNIVLLGSRAAGTYTDDSDFDIIAPTKKDISFFPKNVKVDIFDRYYDLELLEYLHISEVEVKTVKYFGRFFLVPDKYILAMIYLTSIFRIIPYTEDHKTNLQIWLKRVRTYNKLRSEIDYKLFDKMLEDPTTFIGDQFHKRLTDKIERYGDAIVTLEENEEAFFKDSVPRKFEHDYLHKIVGQLNRGKGCTDHLFDRFKNPENNKVGLDKDLFENGNQQDKINMIQEEIITLMLERKIIPTLEIDKKYTIEQFDDDMEDIASHFATNLCGQGTHFLRRWVLDHYTILMKIAVPQQTIIDEAYKICNVKNVDTEKYYTKMSEESLKNYKLLTKKYGNVIKDFCGNTVQIDGDNIGLVETTTGKKFYLEILRKDNIIIFKQIYFNADSDVTVFSKEIDPDSLVVKKMVKKVVVTKIHHTSYYSSVTSCTGVGGYSSYDESDREEIDESLSDDGESGEKQTIRYYLNSYGYGDKIGIYEMIANHLLYI